MRYGSLCSGIGGLDLAVEQVTGASPAWFCEADPHAASVLRRWWPDVPVLPDVKSQDWTTVEPVELVTAGYPCQPFSAAGRRQGAADPRHLWPYVIAAVRVLRPRLVVLENVAGHLGLGFDRVLGDLAEAGFDAEWCVVSASAAGACHRRERLFVVAHNSSRDTGRVEHGERLCPVAYARGERLGEHPGEGDEPHGDGPRRAAADADRGRLQEHRQPDGGTVGPGVEASRRGDVDGRGEAAAYANCTGLEGRLVLRERRDERAAGTNGVGVWGDYEAAADTDGMVGSPAVTIDRQPGTLDEPGTVERTERLHRVDWGDYGPAIRRWEHVLGRPAPAPTDDKGRLAVSFVEWMQGFDEGWVDSLTRTAALRCLGNAVVQQQGALALTMLGVAT